MSASSEILAEIKQHVGNCLPAFVWASHPAELREQVPVFVYHSILPAEFESHLQFLAENDYQTIDCSTLLGYLQKREPIPPRTVMLTIDDGRTSVWRYAVPLLERYGMTAVVFLIPGLIPERGSTRPRLFDGLSGREPPLPDTPDRDGLMSWQEVEACFASGRIDFQSHTHMHHRVPVSDRLLGFLGPKDGRRLFDLPLAPGDEPLSDSSEVAGYPVFEHDSLMSGRRVFRPDPGFLSAIREQLSAGGREAFFARNDWAADLFAVAEKWRREHGSLGRLEDLEETKRLIRASLEKSRQTIEGKLPGHSVRHLCYPYTLGSDLSIALSQEAGYLTNFWGVLPDRRSNSAGDDPFRIARLKSDFLRRLPGRRRISMIRVFSDKARRRLSGQPVY